MKTYNSTLLIGAVLIAFTANAHISNIKDLSPKLKTIVVKKERAEILGLKIHETLQGQLALAEFDESKADKLSEMAHEDGQCGGFHFIDNKKGALESLKKSLAQSLTPKAAFKTLDVTIKKESSELIKLVTAESLKNTVTFLTSFKNRYAKSKNPNMPILKIKDFLSATINNNKKLDSYPMSVQLIDHKRTKQKSIHVQIKGSMYPTEHVVLGAHIDSTGFTLFGDPVAPGADDDASGSSNLMEVIKIMAQNDIKPERTIDFYFYGAEEIGLVGSGEIAAMHKKEKTDIIGALQLDMTLFPGSGFGVVGLTRDFTDDSFSEYLVELADAYIPTIEMVDTKCNYACSDHASWNKNGFPSAFPFESEASDRNRLIHTKNDKIDPRLDFEHSKLFAQLALLYVVDIGNSRQRFTKSPEQLLSFKDFQKSLFKNWLLK